MRRWLPGVVALLAGLGVPPGHATSTCSVKQWAHPGHPLVTQRFGAAARSGR